MDPSQEDAVPGQGEEGAGFAALPSGGFGSEGASNWKHQADTGHHYSDEQLEGSEMALTWKITWKF